MSDRLAVQAKTKTSPDSAKPPGQCLEEGGPIGIVNEDVGAVIAAVKGVVDQALVDGAR
jgi:hypothetical protein